MMTRIHFFSAVVAAGALLGATQTNALVMLTEREVACHSDFGDCNGASYSIEPAHLSFDCLCYDNDIYSGSFIDKLENIEELSDAELAAECEAVLARCEDMTASSAVKEVAQTEDAIQMSCETDYGYCDWTFSIGEPQSWVECPCDEQRDWGVAMDMNPEDINVRDMSRNCVFLLESCEEESPFTEVELSDTDTDTDTDMDIEDSAEDTGNSNVTSDTDGADNGEIEEDTTGGDDVSDDDSSDEVIPLADNQNSDDDTASQNLSCSTLSAGAFTPNSLLRLLFSFTR